jgi:DNA-binding Lrp family transcriptional regulator
MDAIDRNIINALQGGFPISDRPYAEAAAALGLSEEELIARLSRLLEDKTLTRFGPMYNVEAMGGAFTLAAMVVPRERFEEVAAIVNGYAEVAHNYERVHQLNMWFVIAAERRSRIAEVIRDIEARTGLEVCNFPKLEEFYVGFRVEA